MEQRNLSFFSYPVCTLYPRGKGSTKTSMNNNQMEQRKGRRLVLFPLPLEGHFNPMIQLANMLHSKGFSITIIHTSLNSPHPSQYPHFTFHFIHENLPDQQRQSSPKPDLLALISSLNTNCADPFQDCLSRLLSDAAEEPVSCLISDAIFDFTRAVADNLNIPRIVLRTGAASSFLIFAAFPFLKEKGYLPLQESKLEEELIEFPPLKVKDLPSIKSHDPEAIDQLVVSMVNEAKASSGVIFNTFEELEEPALSALRAQFPTPLFPIGPFHNFSPPSSKQEPTDQSSIISWLDKQEPKSVIYVSFGSLARVNETEFIEIAWGLANCKQPFLWVVRQGLVGGMEWTELLPNGLLEGLNASGKIVKWAPQPQVLAHESVGAFWTHNGWNSTLESICEGVPMICMPRFTDQMINARYVSDVWRVGIQIEDGIERGKVEEVLKLLVVEKDGEEIRSRAADLKEKAKHCLMTKDGSSFRSLDNLVSHILKLENPVFQAQ